RNEAIMAYYYSNGSLGCVKPLTGDAARRTYAPTVRLAVCLLQIAVMHDTKPRFAIKKHTVEIPHLLAMILISALWYHNPARIGHCRRSGSTIVTITREEEA
ncbi:MAG: hypothetical protein M3R61_13385, partial [Chloroflexota bacterium]|nr:hypothetical protein [Chloroflexota bacterium]